MFGGVTSDGYTGVRKGSSKNTLNLLCLCFLLLFTCFHFYTFDRLSWFVQVLHLQEFSSVPSSRHLAGRHFDPLYYLILAQANGTNHRETCLTYISYIIRTLTPSLKIAKYNNIVQYENPCNTMIIIKCIRKWTRRIP